MHLGFFVYSRLLCIQDEWEGIVMDNYCDYWMLASPFRNCRALDWKGCWSLEETGRRSVSAAQRCAARLPSPGRSDLGMGVTLIGPKRAVPPQLGCPYSMNPIYGKVVEMPGRFGMWGCSVKGTCRSDRGAKHLEILDKCKIHPSGTTSSGWKRRHFLQAKCSSESDARPLLRVKRICSWDYSKLSDVQCTYSMFV